MPHSHAVSGRQIIKRWAGLAERRLDYLTDLFESGRWRRYHTEADFLDNVQEARGAVDRWRALAIQEATADNQPVTWSWLDRPDGVPSTYQRGALYQAQPALRVVEAPAAVAPVASVALVESPALQPQVTPPRAANVEPDIDWRRALDPDVLGERYPMLRAAM